MPENTFKRATATKKKITEFREKYVEMTDEVIIYIISATYPNIFVDNFEVAIEIVRELIRRREEYTIDIYKNTLIELYKDGKLKRYTIEVQQQNLLFAKKKALIEYIYETAQERTLYLSECENYNDLQLKEYFDEICKQKEKPLSKVLQSLLNVEAMYRTSDDVFVQRNYLQFHCYTEPNGDIVFTKNHRPKECYDEEGKPLYSEEEILKCKKQSTSNNFGCLSVIVIMIVMSIGIILIYKLLC